MRYLIVFILVAALLSGCNAPLEVELENESTTLANASLSHTAACPRQMVDCASPGICVAYTDANTDQLCDASQKP